MSMIVTVLLIVQRLTPFVNFEYLSQVYFRALEVESLVKLYLNLIFLKACSIKVNTNKNGRYPISFFSGVHTNVQWMMSVHKISLC